MIGRKWPTFGLFDCAHEKKELIGFFHKNRKNATNIMTNTPFNVVQKVKNIWHYFQRVYYLYPLFN